MNPEDQLRSLRDNSRWTFGELQPRATARPADRRQSWLTLPAIVAEIAVVAVVVAAVVGVVSFQNRTTPPEPVAVAPTLSPIDEGVPGTKRSITPATCTNLLDDKTMERLTREGYTRVGEVFRDKITSEPALGVDQFFDRGLVCRWSNSDGGSVEFAFAPTDRYEVADEKRSLIAAGSEKVPGEIDRLTNPSGDPGGFAFGDGYWIYTDSTGAEDFLPAVFTQAQYRAAGGKAPNSFGTNLESMADGSRPVEWLDRGRSITILVSGGSGCVSSPTGEMSVTETEVVIHLDDSEFQPMCGASFGLYNLDIDLGTDIGSGPVTVTVIHDDAQTYTKRVLE